MTEERRTVTASERCDTDILYGPLSGAIEYLKEIQTAHPEASLAEEWFGYEDMELRFIWDRIETDNEFYSRVDQERRDAERLAANEARDRNAAQLRLQAQIDDLTKARDAL